MTKQEFIDMYCKNSGEKWEELKKREIPLPCACGEKECRGWMMASNNPNSIELHNDLYGPDKLQFPGEEGQ